MCARYSEVLSRVKEWEYFVSSGFNCVAVCLCTTPLGSGRLEPDMNDPFALSPAVMEHDRRLKSDDATSGFQTPVCVVLLDFLSAPLRRTAH